MTENMVYWFASFLLANFNLIPVDGRCDMEISKLDEIRKIGIIAMFSDDDLMEMLVLKGANAISLICKEFSRASVDLDFAMKGAIDTTDITNISDKIRKTLEETFLERGYIVFDFEFTERPAVRREGLKEFWGGYRAEFKIIEKERYVSGDIDGMRKISLPLGDKEKKAFIIDISKYDYCEPKWEVEMNGYTIYVYTAEMVVIEKIRAICQQMPEYRYGNKSARAKDFYDIYVLMESFKIDLMKAENLELFKLIFGAKEVPLSLIKKIPDYREYHRGDFVSVIATVYSATDLKEYDFYFDYVVNKTQMLKILWGK